MVPSTVDPDASEIGDKGKKGPKKGVRISAWRLAKLDSNEAMRAAAKARASSSVLRPVDNRRLADSEISSSDNASIRSSMSTDTGGNKDVRNDLRLSPQRNFAPSQESRDEYETHSISSFSSPSHVHETVTLSPLPQAHGVRQYSAASFPAPVINQPPISRPSIPIRNNPPSGSADSIVQISAPSHPTSLLRDIKRTSVVWDQEAGRYVSVPLSASDAHKRPYLPAGVSIPGASSTSAYDKQPFSQPRESSQVRPPAQQSEKLTYTGDSIFFGGPLLSAPIRDGLKNERVSGLRDGQDRLSLGLPRESRFKRDAVSNQLPIFVPGDFELHPHSTSGPQ